MLYGLIQSSIVHCVCWPYILTIISLFSDTSLERFSFAELSAGDNISTATCLTTGLVWDLSVLPTLYLPTSQTEPPSIPGPLDLSSPSSLSSSASSCGEEDEGRTSDPPSPEPVHTYAPRQRMKCTGVMPRINPPEEEEEREAPVTAARPAFLCKHCPKEYTSLGALKMHIRSHTLPCVCTTCGKAFSRPWLLRGHIRTHTGKAAFHNITHLVNISFIVESWLNKSGYVCCWETHLRCCHCESAIIWSVGWYPWQSVWWAQTLDQQTLSHREALCGPCTHWSLIVFNVPATMTRLLIILSWLLGKRADLETLEWQKV